VTGVQVRVQGPGEASIVVTADGALVDYASFAELDPPRLVIDLPHARNAISQPVNLPAGSPILRIQTMQIQQGPIPALRLVLDLKQMLPYRVELTGNSLLLLVRAEVSESAPVAQEPTELERVAEPMVSPVEPVDEAARGVKPTVSTMVAVPAVKTDKPATPSEKSRPTTQPPAVSPPTAKEETPLPLPRKSAAQAAVKRRGGEATSGPGQEAPPSPLEAAKQPITPAPATSKVAAANKRLSLDFKGADLDDLLRLISEVSGLNIVAAHGLKDRKDRDVTVRMTNIEWRQALDVILRAKGLSYEQDGNMIYVGSKGEIQKSKEERAKDIEQAGLKNLGIEDRRLKVDEERKRAQEEDRRYAEEPLCTKVIHLAHTKAPDVKKHLQRLRTRRGSIELEETTNTLIVSDAESVCLKMAALAKDLDMPPKDPFVTKLLPFNYAKAADLKTHLAAFKSKDGSIVVDERSSRIIVKDLPETVERMETLLKQIDIRTPQVLIEARIVEATRKFSQSLGIQWGGAGIPTKPGSTTGATVFGGGGNTIQFPGGTAGAVGSATGGGAPFLPVPLAVNLPVTSPYFALGATIGSIANRFLVGTQLSMAETEGKIKTLSSPRVATQDNEEAEIKQGTQVPYTTIDSSGRTVVQFQDAFIKLKVKPHITPDGRVSMKVEAERSFPGERVDFVGGFVFPINTRKATTNILVQNGSTVVIGGLFQSSETIVTDQVPTLGNIPILGWLFKRRSIGPDERVELLIFITPSVLQESRP
jgi:type IV pilus secretin PilQ/predicted competence protein